MLELFDSAIRYKNKYPKNDPYDLIFNSLLTHCEEYVAAVIYAYEKNPACEALLAQDIELINNVLRDPSAENILKSNQHARNFPFAVSKVGSCNANLGGDSVVKSTVCEIAPGERLGVDINYPSSMEATGTYQIEMG